MGVLKKKDVAIIKDFADDVIPFIVRNTDNPRGAAILAGMNMALRGYLSRKYKTSALESFDLNAEITKIFDDCIDSIDDDDDEDKSKCEECDLKDKCSIWNQPEENDEEDHEVFTDDRISELLEELGIDVEDADIRIVTVHHE